MECLGDDLFGSTLEKRVKNLQLCIEKFYTLANLGDMSSAYRNRPIWVGYDSAELVLAVQNLVVEVPAARGAVFYFVGNLLHEAAHFHFMKIEKTSSSINVNSESLTKAVRIIASRFEDIFLEMNKATFSIEMLNWLFALFTDLSQQNSKRPAMNGSKSPLVLLEAFQQCPCVADYIDLFNSCFSFLLKHSDDEAILLLLETARFGERSDWFWLHIAQTFPAEVVGGLLRVGIREFQLHCQELTDDQIPAARLVQLQDECNLKLRSLSEFFVYLADKKRNAALKRCIRETVVNFFEHDDVPGILFLIKIFLISSNIALSVIDELEPYFETHYMMMLLNLTAEPGLFVAIAASPLLNGFLKKIVLQAGINDLVRILEALLPIVFDVNILKRILHLSATFCQEIREELAVLTQDMLTRIINVVHCDKHTSPQTLTALKRYVCDAECRANIVEQILRGSDIGKFYAKLLSVSCTLCDEESIAHLLAQFIFTAKDCNELTNFVSFTLTVTPFFPNILPTAIQHLMANVEKFTSELPNCSGYCEADAMEVDSVNGGSFDASEASTRFVTNLLTLIYWQNKAEPKDELKKLGFGLPDLESDFCENLMSWGLAYVESVSRNGGGLLDERSAQVIDNFLNLMRILQPKVQLRLKHPNRLLVQFTGMIVALLKLVSKEKFETAFDGVDFVCRCYAVTGIFFSYQLGASKNLLISSLFDEVFENCAKLFGAPKNESRVEDELISFEQIPANLLSPPLLNTRTTSISSHSNNTDEKSNISDNEESCLKLLRQTPLDHRTAASMAHSGQFSKRHRRSVQSRVTESHELRILVFVNMVENLCIGRDGRTYDEEMCRSLGEALIERFCSDGITSCLSWGDWKVERESVPKYVEISKRVEQLSFVYDFLLILSEVGLNGIRCAMPLIKMQFAAVLIQLETTPLKDARISASTVMKLGQIFAIFIGAKFLPKLLDNAFHVLSRASNYEAYVILLQLWNVLGAVVPVEDGDNGDADAEGRSNWNQRVADESDFLSKSPGSELLSMIVLVIQRNIATMGAYLPEIMQNAADSVPEDVW